MGRTKSLLGLLNKLGQVNFRYGYQRLMTQIIRMHPVSSQPIGIFPGQ